MKPPASYDDLGRSLTALSQLKWSGGSLEADTRISWHLVNKISMTRGTWAALLEPLGLGQVGHWVVIDGVTDDGVVLVRDPVGEAYGIPMADFAELWGYTILVVEEVSP